MALRKQSDDVLVGLDIGTSKVAAVIARTKADGSLEVTGVGVTPSRGLKKGVVVDIDATTHDIQHAVEEAEKMAGISVDSVFVGIAGDHIRSTNSHGMVAVRGNEVTEEDIQRVVEAASTRPIANTEKVLHVLPQSFTIDGQSGIRQPVGMSGVRLEAWVHLITGSVSGIQNLVKCVQRCDLDVEDIVLEQLASSEAVLSEDERELGVCVVDIGGGTTDIAVFHQGAIRHTAVIPVAGDQVTSDIAIAFRTPTPEAERIKCRFGACLPTLVSASEEIEVPSVGDRPARCLSRRTLAEVIEPRYEELFQLIQDELRNSGFLDLTAAGVVLTGGGSRIEGAVELAEEVFHMPVRLGVPHNLGSLSDQLAAPQYATTVGLLEYGRKHRPRNGSTRLDIHKAGNLLARLKNWFKSSF
ncbi:cell division protein FtsA [Sulfurivirga caldicuralii]|uniref:Cell division protein FtsA n=1 Tax=Sulfurivirga caldicuralii TaxID=364032 RepID=A0A1N6DW66_9GAMM|nr:cell division protein FtsA [Sulfurivirga caldicuralii]SIN74957.1 cell division protein FtsA [Sulfurivirga caldicuralii]